MGLNPKGRNWGQLVNWDDLGKFYAGFIISWTVILYSGVVWLVLNRRLALVKIRNLPLAIAAVSFLHVYLVKIFLAYTTNGHFTCRAEYWIMSIYLPFGIALFQASLVQLRSIFDQQQKFLRYTPDSGDKSGFGRVNGLRRYLTPRSKVQEAYIYIGAGMIVQLIITGALYATTPTLQGNWSSYGNIPFSKGQLKCRKSAEWIPSAFWQLFYAWIYGPYILYSVRNIHETHHWRLQVWLSVVSGLPGAPLWLASVFSTAFTPVNKWWVPPMWLAPGIIVMQAVTVFVPIYEAWVSRRDMRTILSIITDWQGRHGHNGSDKPLNASSHDSSSYTESTDVPSLSSSASRAQMYTMASLEKALAVNPKPLLHYAATRDFTAENIVFLMQVRRWRAAYSMASKQRLTEEVRIHLFSLAVDVYVSSISEKTAEYPINIDGPVRNNLDALFARAVPEGRTAWDWRTDLFSRRSRLTMSDRQISSDSSEELWGTKSGMINESHNLSTTPPKQTLFEPHPGVAPLGVARAKIPDAFNEGVFDTAEQSIKYLVLTNTWRKFVSSGDQDPRNSTLTP